MHHCPQTEGRHSTSPTQSISRHRATFWSLHKRRNTAHLVGGHGQVLEDEGAEQEQLVVLPPEHGRVQGPAPGEVPPGVDCVERDLRERKLESSQNSELMSQTNNGLMGAARVTGSHISMAAALA